MRNIFLLALLTLTTIASAQNKESTANSNVHIIDEVFEMPSLDRTRKIRVYLPPSYSTTNEEYPVLYMHDAQNLFDDSTAYISEWGVDEILNEIAQEGGQEIIVVGIDNNGETRMNEYSPWENSRFGKAEGEAYIDFVVNVIRPFVEKNYRIKEGVESTGVGGSSMGGLISHYAIFKYPDVFGLAMIYSPSYWYAPEPLLSFTTRSDFPDSHKLDFLVGGKEGQMMVNPTKEMFELMVEQNHKRENLRFNLIEEGEHNERFWRSQFKESILWLYQDQ